MHFFLGLAHSMDIFAFLSVLLEIIRETVWTLCIHHAAHLDLVIYMLATKMRSFCMPSSRWFVEMASLLWHTKEAAAQQSTVGGMAFVGMCHVSVNGEIILMPVLKICLILLFKYSQMKLIALQLSHLDSEASFLLPWGSQVFPFNCSSDCFLLAV